MTIVEAEQGMLVFNAVGELILQCEQYEFPELFARVLGETYVNIGEYDGDWYGITRWDDVAELV